MKRLLSICSVILFFLFLGVLIIRNTKGNSNEGFTIGVEIGTIYEELGQDLQKIKLLRGFHDVGSQFHALADRQVDAVITDRLIGLGEIQKKDFQNIFPVGELRFREEKAAAIRKNDNSLRQMLNRGLAEIMQNGQYETISKYYFGRNIMKDLKETAKLERTKAESVADDGSWEAVRRRDWLIFAFSANNPPFSYYNVHHVFTGFDIEIAREVCHRLGIGHFLAIPIDDARMMAGLRAGIYDAVWGGIPVNKITRTGFNFTNPFCITGAQLFVREGVALTGFRTLGLPKLPEPPPIGEFLKKEDPDDFYL